MTDAALLQNELLLADRLDGRFFALSQTIDDTDSINRAARGGLRRQRRSAVAGESRMTDATLLQSELRLAGRLDAHFFALLQAIDDTDPINRAARAVVYSDKSAWLPPENRA